MKKWLELVISILIVGIVAYLSSLANINSIPTWYESLAKPSFNPPNWIFGPVWTILYLMIGIALFLVWASKIKPQKKTTVYWVFGIQLFLNGIWSLIFFGAHQIFLALIVIALLWISIILNMLAFYKISKASAYLLVPYWLWVSFASVLNFSIWMLNK